MGHMLKTSERLQQGAKLYYQQFMSKVAVDMSNKPNVDYPNKIERYYFKEVIYLTNEKAVICDPSKQGSLFSPKIQSLEINASLIMKN